MNVVKGGTSTTEYKRIFIYLFIGLQLFTSCKTNVNLENKTETKSIIQKKLAFELCMIYGSDQGVRDDKLKHKDIKIGALFKNMDSVNFDKLILFVNKNGYPNKKLLGDFYLNECVSHTAGAVLLHNSHRLVNEKKYFNLFFNEVKKGNMKKEAFVLILDRYYWAKSHGKKVLYGSQFGKPCLENKIVTNRARKKIGLESLEDKDFKICSEK